VAFRMTAVFNVLLEDVFQYEPDPDSTDKGG
jgi:hypothetical protein